MYSSEDFHGNTVQSLPSLLQLTSGVRDNNDYSPETLESELQRLSVIDESLYGDKDTHVKGAADGASGGRPTAYTRSELFELKELAREPYLRFEKLYGELSAHAIDQVCISEVALILELCNEESQKHNSFCYTLKKILKKLKRVHKRYLGGAKKFSQMNRKILSSIFALNSLTRSTSVSPRVSESIVSETLSIMSEVNVFMEVMTGFVSYIVLTHERFCSVGAHVNFTNKVAPQYS